MPLPRFHFIHGYREPYWDALNRQGLIDAASGVKVTQIFATPDQFQFNQIAQRDSNLHNEIMLHHRTFYIDRMLGGGYYSYYPYDPQLIEYYQTQLGPDFLGFQFHEWASNYRDDWIRIKKCLKNIQPPWTAQQIREGILPISKDPDHINLSVAEPEFYAKMGDPTDRFDFLNQLQQLYNARQKETVDSLVPADSYFMAPFFEIGWGCRALLPEMGAQIPLTRVQMALTRGMAQLHEKPWGGYYESWGGKPFSVNFALKDEINEWFIKQEKFDFNFASFGENGGSSRALQRRLLYYLLFSGAQFVAEEWGMSNTFSNWQSCPLTEFGEIKRELIQFAAHSQEWPHVFIPIAVLLPKEFPIVDLTFLNKKQSKLPWRNTKCQYLQYPIHSRSERLQLIHLQDVIQWLYGRKKDFHAYGNETHVMTNSGLPDLCDLLYPYEFQSKKFAFMDQIAQKYPYFIDLTEDFKQHKDYDSFQNRCIAHQTKRDFYQSLQKVYATLPMTVSGPIHWMINAEPNHPMIICSLFNNNGIERTAQHGDVALTEATQKGLIQITTNVLEVEIMKSWPSTNQVHKRAGDKYEYTLAPGGVMILKWNKKT